MSNLITSHVLVSWVSGGYYVKIYFFVKFINLDHTYKVEAFRLTLNYLEYEQK